MPFLTTDDDLQLHYEETGSGEPIIFVHEFAGDHRSWEPQVRHFARWYRCVTFDARGYPPSDVPEDPARYSQQRAARDVAAVMDHLEIERAHIVGLSMGGFAALQFGFDFPGRALSLCVAGAGYGAEVEKQDLFKRESEISAAFLKNSGMEAFAEKYATGPTRQPFLEADPRGYREFCAQLAEHSALGSANTQLGVQRNRPSLYQLTRELAALPMPVLIFNGDEDYPCLAPGIMMKQTIPGAALSILPNCGHTMNIEHPDEFNRILGNFLLQAVSGRWPMRQRGDLQASVTGMVHHAADTGS
jgi:pimeloyl-ACP methyl ester carboxylesterase